MTKKQPARIVEDIRYVVVTSRKWSPYECRYIREGGYYARNATVWTKKGWNKPKMLNYVAVFTDAIGEGMRFLNKDIAAGVALALGDSHVVAVVQHPVNEWVEQHAS